MAQRNNGRGKEEEVDVGSEDILMLNQDILILNKYFLMLMDKIL